MRDRNKLGDMSQVITGDFNKIQVKRKQILRKRMHVSYFYICVGVNVDFDVALMHLQPREE